MKVERAHPYRKARGEGIAGQLEFQGSRTVFKPLLDDLIS